ncbi:MAG: hypothetical protein ACXVP1_07185, partial [Thermoleophilia bacterium]
MCDATEALGRLLVAGALRRDHVVTAFGPGRAPSAPAEGVAGDRLQTAPGDVLDRAAVTAAMV